MYRTRGPRPSILFFLLICFLAPVQGNAEKGAATFASLLGSKSGLSVVDLESGKEIVSVESERALSPASTLKLITSIVALDTLTPWYTFSTQVFRFPGKEAAIGIRGGGDPELTTERAYLLAREIRLQNISDLKKVVLDSTALQDPSSRRGERAYESASSALSFNFNSFGLQICPTRKGTNAAVRSLVWEDNRKVSGHVDTVAGFASEVSMTQGDADEVRVGGSIGEAARCVTRYLSNPNPLHSFGRYFGASLEQLGAGDKIRVEEGRIPPDATTLLNFESKPLSELIAGLNHYSTNVSAEQLVAAIGANSDRLNRRQGLIVLNNFVKQLGYSAQIFDASGLSAENRLSPRALTSALFYAWKRPRIRPYLEASLPVLGETGTLRKRTAPLEAYQVFAKSGTLSGVSTLAGYLHLSNGRTYGFSIMQNDVVELARAHDIEEKILENLAHYLK